jgi:hypothetical protein
MKVRRTAALVSALVSLAAAPGRADVVSDWNQTTIQMGGPLPTRTLAMVHLAMFDAVNSVDPRYEPYAFREEVATPTSPEAAAVGAAYGVLRRRFGASSTLDSARATSLAAIPDGPEKDAGLALGDVIAAKITALRANDGMLQPNLAYVPGSGPGEYQLTPPGFVAPIIVGAAEWVPFAMRYAAQFRASGPPPLRSRRWARDLQEVQTLGAVDSIVRTPEETQIANWHVEQGQFSLNRVARTEAAANGLNLFASARLFALLNLAFQDAVQSVFEAKYHYRFWRPVTAIRVADTDGNPDTEPELDWAPLLVTPPHPEYPAAHGVVSGAGLEALKAVFGRKYAFTATSANVPGVTREFESFDAFLEDVKVARIYGGIHYRGSVEDGAAQGRRLGRWIVRNFLRPRRCD